MALYIFFESAPAYALFRAHAIDPIGEDTIDDLNRFRKVMKLTAFHPLVPALDGLTQINAEGIMTDELKSFLELSLLKVTAGKEPKFSLGVSEPEIGSRIFEETKIPCQCNDFILELLRGVRMHFDSFIKDWGAGDTDKAQLALGHSYSIAKVKSNVNHTDNMIIQAISLLDTLDKSINSLSMRVRKLYSRYRPELAKIVNNNYQYAKVAKFVQNKFELSEDNVPGLIDILGDEAKARKIIEASKSPMGQDISPIELINVQQFAQEVINLSQFREKLYQYLVTKMNDIAPTLSSVIGEVVGAYLISRAGSLTNLAKCPSSKLQILGAKKAPFRAHSGKKGRMARYLANKCSLASRIDCFSDGLTTAVREQLREQVEERRKFYDKGFTGADALVAMEEDEPADFSLALKKCSITDN